MTANAQFLPMAPIDTMQRMDTELNTGDFLEIRPGVFWIRLPLPFELNHINVWLIKESDGWTLIDTGLASKLTRSVWQTLFEQLLDGQPIQRVIVTHHHVDHMSLSGWLCKQFNAPLWTSAVEFDRAHLFGGNIPAETQQQIDEYFGHYAEASSHQAFKDMLGMAELTLANSLPERYHELKQDDELTLGGYNWQVSLHGGHSPGQVMLHCEELNLLIVGDHILPDISSNIGAWPDTPTANPLREYLESLCRLQDIPAEVLVLPAHGQPFTGLHARIHALWQDYEGKLNTLLHSCREAKSLDQLLPILFRRKLTGMHLPLALAEAQACVNYLIEKNQLEKMSGFDNRFRYLTIG